MSASISCNERARAALESLRNGVCPPLREIKLLGEECPGDFFRVVIESLADSFDPLQCEAYDNTMRAWDLERAPANVRVPLRVEVVYVLSRVTLGADIKITSMILSAMKQRFPSARIVFVAGRKSIELFEEDDRIEFLEAAYPRMGPVSTRIAFGRELRERLDGRHAIVVDPDSRMTQLGLIPACDPDRYFHFPSRTASGASDDNLTDLTAEWLTRTFGNKGRAYLAPKLKATKTAHPFAAISLGVGENASKRVGGEVEAGLIRMLGERFQTVYIDRGVGGEEWRRVTAAVEESGLADRVKFLEGSFGEFVSVVARSALYAGYDSAGQHAAAAAGVPLLSIFAGAPSEVFRSRWAPVGPGKRMVLNADGLSPASLLEQIAKTAASL